MGVQGSNSEEPIWTHLKQIESLSWTLSWALACILVLQIMSSPLSSFFFASGLVDDFPSKMVPCRFSLNLPLFGPRPSSKGHGSALWLSPNRIAQFHWTLNLRPSSKVALNHMPHVNIVSIPNSESLNLEQSHGIRCDFMGPNLASAT